LNAPPDFFAPNLFPGPSFALFTAPCCACDACRTKVKTGEGFLIESCAKTSVRLACVPGRVIDVIAARNGGCNRGSSIGVWLLDLEKIELRLPFKESSLRFNAG
jgi:hypothetical protein